MMQHLDTFLQILIEPPPFTGSTNDDKDACERLLKEFSSVEAEELANASYAYWLVNSKAKDRLPVDSQRNSALKEIRRHYVGEGRNYAKALTVIREALGYRRKYRVNILRSCYDDNDDYKGEDADLAKKYRSFVLGDLERQSMVVRGVDSHSRTIVYKPPRTSSPKTADVNEAFLLTQIYTAERAIATNEFTSKGKEENVAVVFSCRDYDRKNSPSTSTIITLLKILQRCYPERLGVLIIIDPPFWMRAVFNMLWPLLSTASAEKIKLPSGQIAVDEEFSKVVSGNKKLRDMLASGDISSVNLTDYTQQPFYCQFEQS